jgi:type II secretory pathway component GspD/PulD (secretin)
LKPLEQKSHAGTPNNSLGISNMIKQLASKTIRKTLFLGAFLIATTPALAAETSSDQPVLDVKNEKHADREITLAELGSLAERWFKMEVLIDFHADTKIRINLNKAPLSYGQLLTQLNFNGFTAYKSNGYIQIIPNRDARNLDIPIVEKYKTYLEDEYVTEILKIEKACASRVLAAIRPLVPQYGFLTAYEDANTLLIVDTYGNIQRVKTVIKALEANIDEKEECGISKKSDPQSEKK